MQNGPPPLPPDATPRSETTKLREAGGESAQSSTETAALYTVGVSISQTIDNDRSFSLRTLAFYRAAAEYAVRWPIIYTMRAMLGSGLGGDPVFVPYTTGRYTDSMIALR